MIKKLKKEKDEDEKLIHQTQIEYINLKKEERKAVAESAEKSIELSKADLKIHLLEELKSLE